MVSTRGWKRRELPESLQEGLRALGYRSMTNTPKDLPEQWRHPGHAHLFVTAAASNIPGDTAVVASWFKTKITRVEVDVLLARLDAQLREEGGANRVMRR